MPSLIYITRIQPLSAELAQALESSGSHVKSFGPGEITADECILVMTSEAVLAGLRVPGLATGLGRSGAPARILRSPRCLTSRDTSEPNPPYGTASRRPRQVNPRLEKPQPALGHSRRSQRWRMRMTISGLFPAKPAYASQPRQTVSPASLVLPAGREKAPASDRNLGVPLLPVPSTGKAARVPVQISTLLLKRTGLADRIRSANGQRHGRFWAPAVVAAVLLVLALVLLEGRASILPSQTEVTATEPTPQASIQPGTSTNPPRQPKSGDDYVAEDYTTRFDRRGIPRHPATSRLPARSPETANTEEDSS